MDAMKTMKLMEKYINCPECGNDKIGNGQGTLHVGEDTFTRTCKCGWKVIVNKTAQVTMPRRSNKYECSRNICRK